MRVPKVHPELCTRRLLVQERFDGLHRGRHRASSTRSASTGKALAEELLRSTLDQVLRIGLLPRRPASREHLRLPATAALGLIDFGAVGRLDPIQQAAVVDILAALMRRDVSLLRDGIERVAEVQNSDRPEELERALARLIADHVRATGAVDPSVLQDLVATLAQFGIRLPGDLVVLSRALVTVDGTLRVLAPELSLVAAATESMTSARRRRRSTATR